MKSPTRTLSRVLGASMLVAALTSGVVAMTPASAATPGRALLGMSSPSNLWNQRVSEVGPGLQARRIFATGFTLPSLATTACNAGMVPVLSFKTGSYSWADVANGKADSALRALATKLNALSCNSFVAIHHEPNGDGTPADFTAMQAHALPLIGGTAGGKVSVGVIGNGWWFNTNKQGLTDSALDTWVGPKVRAVSDFIAADTYQMKAGAEEPGSKMKRMSAWAARVNAKTPATPVRGLGVGEFNSTTTDGSGIKGALDVLRADPLFKFGCVWNTNLGTVTVLTGARLQAFKTGLASW
jgi:hypothetical protein